MRISTFAALSNNLVFTISIGQLYTAIESLGIDFINTLSPIKKALIAKESLLDSTQSLMNDKDFVKVLKLLTTPELKIEFKGNSALDGSYASAIYCKSISDTMQTVWVQNNADGQMTLICFSSISSFYDYYLFSKNISGDYVPSDPLKGTFTKESFLLFLHTLDCYQHAYLYELINYRYFGGNYIDASDFFALLKKGCEATDLRWLVPFGIHCGPWRDKTEVAFNGEHLDVLINMGLLSNSGGEDSKEQGFIYGGETLYFGLECAAFKKDTFSLVIQDLSGILLSGMAILTAENLHWFDIQSDSHITHKCLDTEQFITLLKNTSNLS